MSDPIPIKKTAYEEIGWLHQMRRTDGVGWLGPTETLLSIAESKVLDEDGTEQAGMLADVTIVEDTKIGFTIKGGTAPADGRTHTKYTVNFKVLTSLGNKLEPRIELYVTA